MATMRLEIVTAERVVYSEDVDVLVAPGIDGQLGILPNHAPLLTALQPGEIRVVKDGEDTYMAIRGGFMEVMTNHVTILADAAERAEEIDVERAEAAMRRARERIDTGPADLDLQRELAALRRAQARLLAASRRVRPQRRRETMPPQMRQQDADE